MICYQVTVQFTFQQHKPALVSTHIKKQKARARLVQSGLPYGSLLKHRRFFYTEQEAAQYALYLHRVYKNRIAPKPSASGGQPGLF
jgi:hypothetical protein